MKLFLLFEYGVSRRVTVFAKMSQEFYFFQSTAEVFSIRGQEIRGGVYYRVLKY